jgi:hypothetical protein
MKERKAMSYFRHIVRASANPKTTLSKQQILTPSCILNFSKSEQIYLLGYNDVQSTKSSKSFKSNPNSFIWINRKMSYTSFCEGAFAKINSMASEDTGKSILTEVLC